MSRRTVQMTHRERNVSTSGRGWIDYYMISPAGADGFSWPDEVEGWTFTSRSFSREGWRRDERHSKDEGEVALAPGSFILRLRKNPARYHLPAERRVWVCVDGEGPVWFEALPEAEVRSRRGKGDLWTLLVVVPEGIPGIEPGERSFIV